MAHEGKYHSIKSDDGVKQLLLMADESTLDQLQDLRSKLWFRVPSGTLFLGAYMRSRPTLRNILVRPTRLDLESCLIDIANSGECSQVFFVHSIG